MQQAQLFSQVESDKARKKNTRALLRVVKEAGCDEEWYPTDQQQIQCIKEDILALKSKCRRRSDDSNEISYSVIDVGAGDGRVLMEITTGDRYAIEIALPLIEAMDRSINVIGTDFREQQLFDKKTDILFCNPPYLQFIDWAKKVILEANAAVVYLVLPVRWSDSIEIQNALKVRKTTAEIVGEFDYLNADRVARAKVNVLRITLGDLSYSHHTGSDVDPFSLWFDEQFPLDAPATEASERARKMKMSDDLAESINGNGEIIKREGLVRLLDKLYQRDLDTLMKTYQSMSAIPGDLMRELEINVSNVKASLRLKISSLKDLYWGKLFNGLSQITEKLCHATRQALLEKLTARTNVDFSEANAIAVVIWVIKQSNEYFEQQIIDTYEALTEDANVQLYKSNERTIKNDRWRYGSERYSALGPYGLDYRIVLENVGGYCNPGSWSNNSRCGLADRSIILLGDLITLANNIGFSAIGNVLPADRTWQPGEKQHFYFIDKNGEKQVLFEAKAFKNRNLHIRMHESFIQKLNCIHGRLKGWLRSAAEAAAEMDVSMEVAEEAFEVQLKLTADQVPLLCCMT